MPKVPGACIEGTGWWQRWLAKAVGSSLQSAARPAAHKVPGCRPAALALTTNHRRPACRHHHRRTFHEGEGRAAASGGRTLGSRMHNATFLQPPKQQRVISAAVCVRHCSAGWPAPQPSRPNPPFRPLPPSPATSMASATAGTRHAWADVLSGDGRHHTAEVPAPLAGSGWPCALWGCHIPCYSPARNPSPLGLATDRASPPCAQTGTTPPTAPTAPTAPPAAYRPGS